MKLKHIKLFENFQSPDLDPSMVFDWMPYDAKVNDPIQQTMPEKISYSELPEWASKIVSEGREQEVKDAGLLIAHYKTPNEGFNRVIVSSFEPLKMDLASFNSNYEKVSEFKDVEPSDITGVSKGSSLLRRTGISFED